LGKECVGCGKWVDPFILGDGYLYAGAGHDFSIALRRDGSLWTWGTGGGSFVSSSVLSQEPVRVGDNAFALRVGDGFTLVNVDNHGGQALAQDGRLWAWNSNRRLRVIADEVTQVADGLPAAPFETDRNR
jgi:alpha-tubulin suppressor-like RCC1 family protein